MHTAQAGPALPAKTQRAEGMWETVPSFLWTWGTCFIHTTRGPPLSPHTHTHTHSHTHVRARSGGLILFNRQGWALCSLRKVKKKKRRIRVAAFMFCCPLILLPGQSTTLGLVPHKWDLSFRRTQWWLMYPTHQSQSFTIALFSRCFYIY